MTCCSTWQVKRSGLYFKIPGKERFSKVPPPQVLSVDPVFSLQLKIVSFSPLNLHQPLMPSTSPVYMCFSPLCSPHSVLPSQNSSRTHPQGHFPEHCLRSADGVADHFSSEIPSVWGPGMDFMRQLCAPQILTWGTKEPDTENCVLWKEWVQLLTCPGSPGSPEMLLTLGTWTVALLCSKLPLVFIGTGYIRGCGCGLHGCGMEETELWAEERLQRSDAGELREPALIGWGCVLSFIHSVETYWPPTTCQKVC